MTAPPGLTEDVYCRRTLVLAPHYDDEILGCGGLLGRLAACGSEIRVLFLSDGAGGVEEVADRRAYAERRRQEAEAVGRFMGFAAIEHLDLRDGSLEDALDELAAAVRGALEREAPDLVLVPSPLEATPDHRAVFAALHEALAPLRDGDPLAESAAKLEVLVYEVNHPFYPEVLIEVGDQLERIAGAMELYSSQQQRHDYLAAALGLRRYRTLTLPPSVEAAEAYVRLRLEDFVTRSHGQLVRRLGGDPVRLAVEQGPRISVVVRTRNRPRLLAEALGSLADSRYTRLEVVLVNDGGEPPAVPAEFPWPLKRVDLPQNLGRSRAADAGIEAATGDFVGFLDDDDLAAPEHLETLARMVSAAGVRVAYTDAAIGVYELDGESGWRCVERRLPYSRDFDPDVLRLDNYIPFNTLLIERPLLLEAGPFDPELPFFEDWDLLLRLARKAPFHHLSRVTCEYRHFRGGGEQIFGESPRRRANFLAVKARVLAKHGQDLDPQGLARAVDKLRAEAVEQGESARVRGRELEELRRELEESRGGYFRLNGRMAALEGDHRRLQEAFDTTRAAFQAKADEEAELRRVVADQEAHLGRTYAEIERLTRSVEEQSEHLGRTYAEIGRLTRLIEAMEQTRAWRLHQWVESRRRG